MFDPYPSRRSRLRVPAWLVTAVVGIAIGAGGVLFVQERYLPPRLSPEQSERLQRLAEKTEQERARLAAELSSAQSRIQATAAEHKSMTEEVAAARKALAGQRSDIAALLEALPPDPRGGTIAVRAARFERDGGDLVYHVVLSREKSGKPFGGVMQFVVAGSRAGAQDTVTLDAAKLAFSEYENLRGRLALPEGFEPRQATVNVLDAPGGKLQGMRILYVK